ncbi:DUF5666 domain-containing protein [Leifsonia sp. SIMBA_070]|uniref:DUF5666 domain-containing protein n=1 Tax=Leifsonia sp. SIMBA_070 TaxID=3085810 RepID=UPI00397C5BD6
MSNTQPTEPLPPRPDQPTSPYPPNEAGVPRAVPAEPFYKRHGLAFAISTLVLSIVVLLGLFTAGAFAVASVVTHVGERMISHAQPQEPQQPQPGVPGLPGRPGDGSGSGGGNGGGQQGGNGNPARELVRGTIASLSGDTWTLTKQNGGTVTVKLDSSTAFGLPGQPASKSDFAKGDAVIVVGKASGGTVTATRVLKLAGYPTRPPSTPGTSQTPGS